MALEKMLKYLRIVAVLSIFSISVYCATTSVSAIISKIQMYLYPQIENKGEFIIFY